MAPYCLRCGLQGLQRYYDPGFRDLSAGCLACKQQLVAEKDVVVEGLKYHVKNGEPTTLYKSDPCSIVRKCMTFVPLQAQTTPVK